MFEMAKKMFNDADTNNDGKVDTKELRAAVEAHRDDEDDEWNFNPYYYTKCAKKYYNI